MKRESQLAIKAEDGTDRLGCSPRTRQLVGLLTKQTGDHKADSLSPAEEARYYAAIKQDDEAVCLKLLDRADNLTDLRRALDGLRGGV